MHLLSILLFQRGAMMQSLQPLGICITGPHTINQTFSPSAAPSFGPDLATDN